MPIRMLLVVGLVAGSLTWWFWGRTLESRRQLEAISQRDYQKAYGYLGSQTTSAGFVVIKEGDRWVIQEFNF